MQMAALSRMKFLSYPYLSDTEGLYNPEHIDKGSRWPDLRRYHRSDKGHWHTHLYLQNKRPSPTWNMIRQTV